ncbi:hypothetical protein ZOSMA_122G00690 [Zostera marina]|uniref:Uncharacterized protein n=1 Tax=Zostera marina TaxID=29655 RepID=A0A0K9Q0I5_ZOSMR|nr:hypothetical protein ZOSMA_122G00690 [Zostera marina]
MEFMSAALGEDSVKESFLDRFKHHSKFLWNKQSIYRVPSSMRDLNNRAYQPQVVSIGPYHNGNSQLEAMEEHKYRALQHFLSRAYNISVEELVAHFKNDDKFMEKVMDSYTQPIDPQWWDSNASTLLTVLDGCFLFELLLSSTSAYTCGGADSSAPMWCYGHDDPIFGVHAERQNIVPYVKLDMLLVENQIPLIILERLAKIAELEVNWNDLIRSFYGCRIEDRSSIDPLGLHVLDVYRKGRIFSGEYTGWTSPKAAKELENHGIRFKRSLGGGSGDGVAGIGGFKDVSFETTTKKRGIDGKLNKENPKVDSQIATHGDLYLPFLTIDEATEPILLNLMAFERLHLGKEARDMTVTQYVFLMNSLIRSEADVRCLRRNSILSSSPERSDGAVTKLFADITSNLVVDDVRGVGTMNEVVRQLCNRRLNSFKASWANQFGLDKRMWIFVSLMAYGLTFALINTIMNKPGI